MHYPLILLPKEIKDIVTTQPTPTPFRLAPPPKPSLTQPQPIQLSWVIAILSLGIASSIIFLISGKLENTFPFLVIVLILTVIAVGYTIQYSRKTYPLRLREYERQLQRYQQQLESYDRAKQAYAEEQALFRTPDGIRQVRQLRLKKALATVKTDGIAPNPNIGRTENYFLSILEQYFPDKIYIDRKISIPNTDQHYSPDLIYIDTEYNLHIDIEIDEPYSLSHQQPVHYIGKDDQRNQTILERKWVIIRFAEEQIVRYPEACCKTIAKVIAEITQTEIPPSLQAHPDLEPYPMWTLAQARDMALKGYRNTYLDLLPSHPKRARVQEAQPSPSSAPFVPSPYQQAIFDFALNGTGDILVEAVAGSGKSRTLLELSKLIPNLDGIFLAFNKSVATELQAKLGNRMPARSINSIGKSIVDANLGRCQLDQYKYEKIAREVVKPLIAQLEKEYQEQSAAWHKASKQGEEPVPPPTLAIATKNLTRLAALARFTLIDPTDIAAVVGMCEHYGIALSASKPLFPKLPEVLELGKQQAQQQKVIDFTDQIWLPTALDLTPPKRYEWIFADECQDFSPCQLELILRIRSQTGRIVFVGDPYQAIYGFAGADTDSIEKIKARTQPTALPLSICYRCPASHIRKAQEIVPHIEARPAAPEGNIYEITVREVANFVEPGDLIISRTTAPLLEMCLRLLAQGIKAQVKGEDLGASLLEIINETSQLPQFDIKQFSHFLGKYEQKQKQYLRQIGSEQQQIEAFEDKVDAIRSAYQLIGEVASIEELSTEIGALLEQGSEKKDTVELCTIHKAKGLEADRVFFLYPERCPLVRAGQKQWELKQEMNLKYVALTRAKQELFLVSQS
ncbi:MAG: UvrD-helicase domain-containing protein [Pseudanabaenaceae cyanobacterium]